MEMDDTDVSRDSATVPLSWPVVVDTETQVDVRFGDGCGRPAGWLDSEDAGDVPNEFPVGIEVATAEPSCFPVVVQTRPQVICDTALPLPVYKGQESLMEDDPDDVFSGSIIKRSDVRREICVVSDQGPVVVPKLAAVPLGVPVVVQTRPQVGCGPDLPLPMPLPMMMVWTYYFFRT